MSCRNLLPSVDVWRESGDHSLQPGGARLQEKASIYFP